MEKIEEKRDDDTLSVNIKLDLASRFESVNASQGIINQDIDECMKLLRDPQPVEEYLGSDVQLVASHNNLESIDVLNVESKEEFGQLYYEEGLKDRGLEETPIISDPDFNSIKVSLNQSLIDENKQDRESQQQSL